MRRWALHRRFGGLLRGDYSGMRAEEAARPGDPRRPEGARSHGPTGRGEPPTRLGVSSPTRWARVAVTIVGSIPAGRFVGVDGSTAVRRRGAAPVRYEYSAAGSRVVTGVPCVGTGWSRWEPGVQDPGLRRGRPPSIVIARDRGRAGRWERVRLGWAGPSLGDCNGKADDAVGRVALLEVSGGPLTLRGCLYRGVRARSRWGAGRRRPRPRRRWVVSGGRWCDLRVFSQVVTMERVGWWREGGCRGYGCPGAACRWGWDGGGSGDRYSARVRGPSGGGAFLSSGVITMVWVGP